MIKRRVFLLVLVVGVAATIAGCSSGNTVSTSSGSGLGGSAQANTGDSAPVRTMASWLTETSYVATPADAVAEALATGKEDMYGHNDPWPDPRVISEDDITLVGSVASGATGGTIKVFIMRDADARQSFHQSLSSRDSSFAVQDGCGVVEIEVSFIHKDIVAARTRASAAMDIIDKQLHMC